MQDDLLIMIYSMWIQDVSRGRHIQGHHGLTGTLDLSALIDPLSFEGVHPEMFQFS